MERDGDALRVYLQAPVPLIFADLISDSQITGQRLESPFLYFENTGTARRYRLSMDAVASDEKALRTRLKESLVWQQNGRTLGSQVERLRIAATPHADFDGVDAARAELSKPGAQVDPVFGDAAIEAEFLLPDVSPNGSFTIRSGYPMLLLGDDMTTENIVVDARVAPPFTITRSGQLEAPLHIDGSRLNAALEFVWQGVLHIVEGPDHVLLVVCIALGAGLTMRLFWMVTASTVGHSVTLIATFLRATPGWPWFIQVVEAGIAASVLYASVVALFRKTESPWVFALIGLLHGLGLSFVLGDILGRDSPNLVLSLAAFNIGIEIGQVALLAATLGIVFALSRGCHLPRSSRHARPCSAP